ncbi:MAG: 50S ribosomal protein L13 [Candidatus Pacearchaeota archaeon]|jgi:large subunit ribosomal protein L13
MEKEIVIDGANATMGRLASYAAKQALNGDKVIILNANDVIIVGHKKSIVEDFKELIKKGGSSLKGPRIVRTPERILKRTIRGMLPHKQGRGSDALDRVVCYNDVPEKYSSAKKIIAGKEKKGEKITLKELVFLVK